MGTCRWLFARRARGPDGFRFRHDGDRPGRRSSSAATTPAHRRARRSPTSSRRSSAPAPGSRTWCARASMCATSRSGRRRPRAWRGVRRDPAGFGDGGGQRPGRSGDAGRNRGGRLHHGRGSLNLRPVAGRTSDIHRSNSMRKVLTAACLPPSRDGRLQQRADHPGRDRRRPRPLHGRLVRDRQHPDPVRGGRAQRHRVVPARQGRQHRHHFHLPRRRFDGPQKVMRPRGFVREGTGNAVWGMQFFWPIKAEYLIAYVDPATPRPSSRAARWITSGSWRARPRCRRTTMRGWNERVRDLGYDMSKLRRCRSAGTATATCRRMSDAIQLEGRTHA